MTITNDFLYDALRLLEQNHRDIIYLSFCEKWSDKRIGKQLNMSRSNVQRLKQKIKKQLKKALIGDDINEKEKVHK